MTLFKKSSQTSNNDVFYVSPDGIRVFFTNASIPVWKRSGSYNSPSFTGNYDTGVCEYFDNSYYSTPLDSLSSAYPYFVDNNNNRIDISSFYGSPVGSSQIFYYLLPYSSLPDEFYLHSLDDVKTIFCFKPSNEFDTLLYSELLDNSEQFQMAKSFLIDTDPDKQLDPTYWTDIQLKFFKFVEEYNKNVISLRATKKVNANVSGSISQSGQHDIDLTATNQAINNIASKLQIVVDEETKNITQIISEKSSDNPIVVSSEDLTPWSAV